MLPSESSFRAHTEHKVSRGDAEWAPASEALRRLVPNSGIQVRICPPRELARNRARKDIVLGTQPSLSSLIEAAERGDSSAADALFSALYLELRQLAKRELARQGFPISLGATTLLHQAYIEISAKDSLAFPDRARFMGYAARVMRGLIIDYARNRSAQKRGGQFEITSAGTVLEQAADDHQLSRIGEALDELAKVDVALAEIVDLKFFCGFTLGEIAAMKGISERTAQRGWERARIYLHRAIRTDLGA
jgi:RNA polymerase sigma factor (TIGR02999 family)